MYSLIKPNYVTSFFKATLRQWKQRECFLYFITRKRTRTPMGIIEISRNNNYSKTADLYFWIFSDFAKKGYMRESIEALEGEIFNLGFNRIQIECDSTNLKAIKTAKCRNFSLEGRIRKQGKVDIKSDSMIFGKLKGDE